MIDEAKRREVHVPYTLAEFKEDLKGLRRGFLVYMRRLQLDPSHLPS